MGGNYVFKAAPYYPPLDVVRQNAKAMAEGGEAPGSPQSITNPLVIRGSENVLPGLVNVYIANWKITVYNR